MRRICNCHKSKATKSRRRRRQTISRGPAGGNERASFIPRVEIGSTGRCHCVATMQTTQSSVQVDCGQVEVSNNWDDLSSIDPHVQALSTMDERGAAKRARCSGRRKRSKAERNAISDRN